MTLTSFLYLRASRFALLTPPISYHFPRFNPLLTTFVNDFSIFNLPRPPQISRLSLLNDKRFSYFYFPHPCLRCPLINFLLILTCRLPCDTRSLTNRRRQHRALTPSPRARLLSPTRDFRQCAFSPLQYSH